MGTRRAVKKKAGLDPLDMPLAKGRVAKSSLVFNDGRAFLQIGNLETPVVWVLGLARTAKSTGEEMAASFDPLGSRHVVAFKEVPAEFNPPAASMAAGPAIDGQTEFGLQTDDDHEYFVSKFGDLVGVVRIKRNAGGGWSAGLSKSLTPRVLSDEAVKKGLMPPAGHSGLPKSLESVVPDEYQYWKASGPEAIAMRDALVESGFFTDETIKAVDGELRKVEVQYHLYEPGAPTVAKSLARKVHTLGARVMKVVPAALIGKGFNPFEAADWLEELDKSDAPHTLALLSPPDRSTSPREMARAASTLKGAFLLEHDDTKPARAAFASTGVVFKLAGEPKRIFCSSFPPASSVAWLAKAADGAILKTVEVQGIKVQIDRPSGFVQKGTDQEGNEWSRTYSTDYGFIPKTNGGDGGSLDAFVGPSTKSDRVFWVTQLKADGSFDEYKLFMGFDSPREALDVFKAHIPLRFFGTMSEVSVGMVKSLLNLDPIEVEKALRAGVYKIAGVSYDQLRQLVNGALNDAYPPDESGPCSPCGVYCDDVYDDKAIFYRDGKSFSVAFSYANGTVTLTGEPMAVVRTWVPAANATSTQMRDEAEKAKKKPGAVCMSEKAISTTVVKRAVVSKDDQHYALGIVLEPDIIDAQNDTYSADDIRSAFEKFAEHYRNVGLMHKQMVNDKVQILENYIAPADFQSGDVMVKKGTWLMGVRVTDPDLWAGVKDGSITGFSIGGSAIRKPVAQGV